MEIKNLMFTLCIMLGLIFACVYFDNECREIRSTANTDRFRIRELVEANQELEKEIRLLKTDVYIIQNGYEGGKENGED